MRGLFRDENIKSWDDVRFSSSALIKPNNHSNRSPDFSFSPLPSLFRSLRRCIPKKSPRWSTRPTRNHPARTLIPATRAKPQLRQPNPNSRTLSMARNPARTIPFDLQSGSFSGWRAFGVMRLPGNTRIPTWRRFCKMRPNIQLARLELEGMFFRSWAAVVSVERRVLTLYVSVSHFPPFLWSWSFSSINSYSPFHPSASR